MADYKPLCVIKKVKGPQGGTKEQVTFNITVGERLSMQHALEEYAQKSMVAADVLMYLNQAKDAAGVVDP